VKLDRGARARLVGALAGLAALGLGAGTAWSQARSDTDGKTSLEQRIVGGSSQGRFRTLSSAPGEPYVVRQDGLGTAGSGRESRRRSLIYFSQLTDFQLADEESPARVEFLDGDPTGTASAAFRPWEGLMPQTVNAAIHQVNGFAGASPVAAGDGSRAKMAMALTTGDSADNMSRDETQWVVKLLEGGRLDPNSGTSDPSKWDPFCQAMAAAGRLDPAEAPRYTGVQDENDYFEGSDPVFYDPNDPRGTRYGFWPRYPGLMDRAERPFQVEGLKVPSYVVFGNHDGLVQGNQAANGSFESVATGCVKLMAPIGDPRDLGSTLAGMTPASLQAALSSDPEKVALVPPDENRQFVSKDQYRALHATGRQKDAHGFGFVDPDELRASNGAASYYSWSPKPGIRFIGLDTVSQGGVAGPSADGNVDDPQYRWLDAQLQAATGRHELIFIFTHHAPASLTANVPDEAAPPCTAKDGHGHDVNPGCDLDPRSSQPIHLEDDMVSLLHRYPHVVAWIAGHSHVNSVEPFKEPTGEGGFWSIRLAAEADWPQQSRLLDVMDNRDGTLSIFGTILDHAAPIGAPAPGSEAGRMSDDQLAALSRTFSFNDPSVGAPHGEGAPQDRNVELLVRDPR
jgi:metallophosphoesterase (TIGR03767 family)